MHPVNRADVRELMQEIREKYPTKTIWMYTGDSWEDIYDLPIMQYVDVVVDGEFHVEEKDVKLLWKGSKNQPGDRCEEDTCRRTSGRCGTALRRLCVKKTDPQ